MRLKGCIAWKQRQRKNETEKVWQQTGLRSGADVGI
jgi:hypothetical protein